MLNISPFILTFPGHWDWGTGKNHPATFDALYAGESKITVT